jgi:protein gp37
MNKTAIEWCDYTINPVKGLCPMDCKDNQGKPYCYARRMYKRFKWDETIRYDTEAWQGIAKISEPSRIFVGSTMELFGPWCGDAVSRILTIVSHWPQRTFIFLTKRPEELRKYNPWPANCWVGVSATDDRMFVDAMNELYHVQAAVKFLSLEPLLSGHIAPRILDGELDWLLIGQQTPVRHNIPVEWLMPIVNACNKARIPLFLKNNLKPLLGDGIRQEFPR